MVKLMIIFNICSTLVIILQWIQNLLFWLMASKTELKLSLEQQQNNIGGKADDNPSKLLSDTSNSGQEESTPKHKTEEIGEEQNFNQQQQTANLDPENKNSVHGSGKETSSSAKVSNVTGSLTTTNGSAIDSGKNSTCRASTSSEVSDDSTCGSIANSISKPHKANDSGWEAIQAIRARDGDVGLNHFRLLKKLGCGDIGSVYLVELCRNKCHFAMKVMDKKSLASRKKVLRAQTEMEILQCLDHPFLPTLYTHFETNKFSCLVMEFCPGGDLHILRQKQPGKYFSEQAAK